MRVCRTGGLVRTVDGGGQGTGAHGVTPAAVRRERQLAEQGAVAVVCARVIADVCQRGRSHPWPHVIAAEKCHRSAPGRPAEEQRRRIRAASRWRQQGVTDGGTKPFPFDWPRLSTCCLVRLFCIPLSRCICLFYVLSFALLPSLFPVAW